MANIITVSHCENELIFVAYTSSVSYQLLHILNGPSYSTKVAVSLNILSGTASTIPTPVIVGGSSGISITQAQCNNTLPPGNYMISLVGINYGGTTGFRGAIAGTTFNSIDLPQIVGVTFTMDKPVPITV